MATATLKCVQCGDRYPRDEMKKLNAVSSICKFNVRSGCMVAYASKKGKKEVKDKANKEHALRKKVFYGSDLKTRKKAAKLACHLFIRTRDKNDLCICCNRPLGKNFDAGHFIESGNNPKIRFDEDNIHAQSVYCNQYKGGNSDDYRGNLIKKIGLERVERLESMKGGTVKRTAEDYKEIENYYKAKIKQLTKGE